MALFPCPECGKNISDKAISCPHCGYVLKANTSAENTEEKPAEQTGADSSVQPLPDPEKQRKSQVGIAAAVVAGIALVVILCVFLGSRASQCGVSGCSNTAVQGGDYCTVHTCLESGCKRQRASDSLYCYAHKPSTSYASTQPVQTYERMEDVLDISGVKIESNSSYTICTGSIKNTGNNTYDFVKVKGAFKNSKGDVIDTDWTYAVGSEGLAPDESTTFRMSVSKDTSIKSCDVTVYD